MEKIAISTFGNRISSRLDSANELLFLSLEKGKVKTRERIRIIPNNPLEKLHQIIELKPNVLICGGLTKLCNRKLNNSSIKVISWIKGDIEEVLNQFLEGHLSEPATINSELLIK